MITKTCEWDNVGRVMSLSFSNDNKLAIAYYGGLSIVKDGKVIFKFTYPYGFLSVKWIEDMLVATSPERIFFFKDMRLIKSFKSKGGILAVDTTYGRIAMATWSIYGCCKLTVSDFQGRELWTRDLDFGIKDLSWSSKGVLAAASPDGSVVFFDERGEVIRVIELGDEVTRIRWCEEKLAVHACCPNRLILFDVADPRIPLKRKVVELGYRVWDMAWDEECNTLLFSDWGRETHLITDRGDPVFELEGEEDVERVAWNGKRGALAMSDGERGKVVVFEARSR